MKITTRFIRHVLSILAIASAALPLPGLAQPSELDDDAMQLLRRSTDYLAGLNRFRVDTDATIEAVFSGGQKIQYGQRVAITVARPNRMRAERMGEVVNQTFYYDGNTLGVDLPDYKYYATTSAPPTMEAMLDFARDKLEIVAPGSDLVYKDAFARLAEGLTSAFVVGKSMIGGVPCDHIAFRNAEVDWQIWIQQGPKPFPRKFIVTSKRVPESPQFVVLMNKWDVAPKITASTFKFVPSKDARKIEFIMSTAVAAAKK